MSMCPNGDEVLPCWTPALQDSDFWLALTHSLEKSLPWNPWASPFLWERTRTCTGALGIISMRVLDTGIPRGVLIGMGDDSYNVTLNLHPIPEPHFLEWWLKVSAWNAGDLGSIPGLGRSPGAGNGNWLQYSCLENPMGGGARWATVHRVAKSRTRLNNFTYI